MRALALTLCLAGCQPVVVYRFANDAAVADGATTGAATACAPFSATGCPPGTWCSPTTPGESACVGFGAKGDGESCRLDADGECGSLLACIGRAQWLPVCRQLCDVRASQGAVGSCPAGQHCQFLLGPDGRPTTDGYCAVRCAYNGSQGCERPSEVCMPAELFMDVADICVPLDKVLDEKADCEAAGLGRNESCGPGRLCVLEGGPIECRSICRPSVGDYGVDHPDCPQGATCVARFTTFGICEGG
jgi:hypothetical protein